MKATTKTYEPKLKLTDVMKFSDTELLRFTFNRKSFFRDYKLLHNKEEGIVRERVGLVLSYVDICELAREIRLCFSGAVMSQERQTYTFNQFVIGLMEMHYSNESFSSKKVEIAKDILISNDDPSHISYEWVLFSSILNPYQRYLLFEYLILGYNMEDLAKRRYCTSRTIQNHMNTIIEVLDQVEPGTPLQY